MAKRSPDLPHECGHRGLAARAGHGDDGLRLARKEPRGRFRKRLARIGNLDEGRNRERRFLLADDDGAVRPPDGRETATAVISALSGLHGAWGVRVHDVRASVDALKVVRAWDGGGDGDG